MISWCDGIFMVYLLIYFLIVTTGAASLHQSVQSCYTHLTQLDGNLTHAYRAQRPGPDH